MHLTAADLRDFAARARDLASAGGRVLIGYQARAADLRAQSKGRRRELVTDADRAAEETVVGGLLESYPEHAYLAEEGALTPRGRASSDSDFRWIVDPLDGTTNFVHGLPHFAVAIALTWRNDPIVAVVHAPRLGVTYTAMAGLGAFCDDRRLRVTDTRELADALLSTGFSYNRNEHGSDDNIERIARVLPLCRDLRRYGSAQLDLCMTAAGNFDGYWELYLMPYDVAAGALIVREAGGRVTDLCGGDDWLYGQQILASNGHLHGALLERIGGPPGEGAAR